MRDLYALVQMLQVYRCVPVDRELGRTGSGITGMLSPHRVRWAIKVDFGGHPWKEMES
jgi:hypothetical protein